MTRYESSPIAQTRRFPARWQLVSVPLLLSALVGCGAQSESVAESTDTGNPPVIAEQRLRVEGTDAGVRVLGEQGAVPGGAEVVVTNVASGDTESTSAESDGSFEVLIEGTLGDDYRVEVEVNGNTSRTTLNAADNPAPGFVGKTFLLDSAEGYTLVAGTTASLWFEAAEFGFSAGCNGHAGSYSLCDGSLCASGLGSTDIGCDEARHDQDEWFAAFFTSTPQLTYAGDRLTLSGADATLEFLDREIANPDRSLAGRTWVIDTFIQGGSASNFALQVEPTLVFDSDGSFQVFTTCQSTEGSYTVNGSAITIADLAFAEEPCDGNGSQTAHDHIVQTLGGTLSVEIEAARLTLMNGDLGLGATTE